MPKDRSLSRASIPSVDRLLETDALRKAVERHGRTLVVEAAREILDDVRRAIGTGAETDPGAVEAAALAARIAARADAAASPSLRPVFNLTGTVLHTNLGRANLAARAIEAAVEAAARPSTLEYDVERGGRGDRDSHVEGLLRRLTGAEAATVVNNNAAAVLIVLSTLASGREVPVSRGELVEIGGSFRMPDVMAEAGCILREVGTTNRTHLRDFAAAIGDETGLVMKVHASNYAIQGFTSEAPEAGLAALCRERGVPFAVDLGSGALLRLERYGLAHETTVEETLAAGADLVTFSGDKLLGGPQAGLIVGRGDLIAEVKRNPLKRALRVDKMTLAALAATLALHSRSRPDRRATPHAAPPDAAGRRDRGALCGHRAGHSAMRRGGLRGGDRSLPRPDRLRRASGCEHSEPRHRDPAESRARRRRSAQAAGRRVRGAARAGHRAHRRGRADLRPSLSRRRRFVPRPARPALDRGRSRKMIVATAGHVDHGKTSLVRALTGIDTDRLPEEKRRNLTIDLGFAYVPLEGGGTMGFVDVPGHERFIRNMLCGVAAIDYALLVVAADDGVMPQTQEHLAILDLLGVGAGTVAITKIDRVDPERVDEVAEEVELYLDETRLSGAPCFPVSSVDGSGVETLKAHLDSVAGEIRRRPADGHFRLAVDRAFTVVGAGLVVTGTAFSGSVSVDDRLLLSPRGVPVRVRGIHAQDRKAESGRAGERLALNIVGQSLGKDDVARGDWVVEEARTCRSRGSTRPSVSSPTSPGRWRTGRRCTPISPPPTSRGGSPCSKPARSRRANRGSPSSCSTGRSARCTATASSCGTSRRRAPSAAEPWSTFCPRRADAPAPPGSPI